MNALSLALLYGILWINSVHGSEDNNVRRLSKDIPEQDFADPQGDNALLSSQDHRSLDSQSQNFFRRNLRFILSAVVVGIVVPAALAAIVCAVCLKKGTQSTGSANAGDLAIGGAASLAIFFLFIIALTVICKKDELSESGLKATWRDVMKYYFRLR